MSFRDDFIEALRSVKRDFFREYEYTDKEQEDMARKVQQQVLPMQPGPSAEAAQPSVPSPQPPAEQPAQPQPPAQPQNGGHLVFDDEVQDTYRNNSMEAYRQASAVDESAHVVEDDEKPVAEPVPYRSFDPTPSPAPEPEIYDHGDSRAFIDFGDTGIYDDDKTIISKNTIIRGALQTEDSVRLLGQILGDIDCKSNIVVAGKVRGNTTAANAYIFDAQVDGDVRCEDIITISNDAWVLGNIRAQAAEIDGKVKGNMEIRHMVSIGASSSILGDISTDELEIKRGAFVNGQIMMYSPSRDVLDRFDRFDEQ